MEPIFGIAIILTVAIVSEWIAWRLGMPSILVLLLAGFAAGVYVDPDLLFGDLLQPLVSISVAIILFEGGLTLRLRDLTEVGHVVRNLVSIGIVVTWVIAGLASFLFLGFSPELSALFGAILVVTGPTVIGPLLRHIRPRGQVGPILKWEGMLNDAIGAVLAVLVFEAIIHESGQAAPALILWGVLKTIVIGTVFGGVAALVLVFMLRRHWIPDHLDNAASLSLMVAVFTVSNLLQEESGLLTVTVMGIVIANQRQVAIRHLVEFKENLRTLLLSFLFVMLAARLDIDALLRVGWGSVLFLLALMLVARPTAVFICSWRSTLEFREKVFLSFMAPRGIVAAAVVSIFALRLEERFPGAKAMVPAMFMVIIVTVAVYGLLAKGLARWLDLAQSNPQGVLFIGAHVLARHIAAALIEEGVSVRLIDNNRTNVATARMDGLDAHYGDALSEISMDELPLNDMGKVLAFTANDRVNALAILNFADTFGRAEMYQLPSEAEAGPTLDDMGLPLHLRGRTLFDKNATYGSLMAQLDRGAAVKVTKLTEEFDYAAFQERNGAAATPLFLLSDDSRLIVLTADKPASPTAGQRIVCLVTPEAA